ncbi:MAG: hypothetical protein WAW61_16320 [Methylococcaceae bacterium]
MWIHSNIQDVSNVRLPLGLGYISTASIKIARMGALVAQLGQ